MQKQQKFGFQSDKVQAGDGKPVSIVKYGAKHPVNPIIQHFLLVKINKRDRITVKTVIIEK